MFVTYCTHMLFPVIVLVFKFLAFFLLAIRHTLITYGIAYGPKCKTRFSVDCVYPNIKMQNGHFVGTHIPGLIPLRKRAQVNNWFTFK